MWPCMGLPCVYQQSYKWPNVLNLCECWKPWVSCLQLPGELICKTWRICLVLQFRCDLERWEVSRCGQWCASVHATASSWVPARLPVPALISVLGPRAFSSNASTCEVSNFVDIKWLSCFWVTISKFADFLKQRISVVGTAYAINLTSGKDTAAQALAVAQHSGKPDGISVFR